MRSPIPDEARRRGIARSAAVRRKIDRAELLELHAGGATDGAMALAFGVTRAAVSFARYTLNLPVNRDSAARTAAAVASTSVRESRRRERSVALGLPPVTLAQRNAVEALATGPLVGSLAPAHLVKTLRSLRRMGLAVARPVPPRPDRIGAPPLIWALAPSVAATFSPDALTPLQQRIAAAPRALAVADYHARVYASRLPHLADEINSAAHAGLADAALRYDPTRYQFTTFAARRVRGAILDELRRSGLKGYKRGTSAAAPGRDFSPLTQVDAPADHLPVGWELESLDALDALTRTLPARQREVLRLYFGHGMLLREIGVKFGVTMSAVSKIFTQAVVALRAEMAPQNLEHSA